MLIYFLSSLFVLNLMELWILMQSMLLNVDLVALELPGTMLFAI